MGPSFLLHRAVSLRFGMGCADLAGCLACSETPFFLVRSLALGLAGGAARFADESHRWGHGFWALWPRDVEFARVLVQILWQTDPGGDGLCRADQARARDIQGFTQRDLYDSARPLQAHHARPRPDGPEKQAVCPRKRLGHGACTSGVKQHPRGIRTFLLWFHQDKPCIDHALHRVGCDGVPDYEQAKGDEKHQDENWVSKAQQHAEKHDANQAVFAEEETQDACERGDEGNPNLPGAYPALALVGFVGQYGLSEQPAFLVVWIHALVAIRHGLRHDTRGRFL